jgi:RNA polymerase sigma-70 factor (ECF subfamily)
METVGRGRDDRNAFTVPESIGKSWIRRGEYDSFYSATDFPSLKRPIGVDTELMLEEPAVQGLRSLYAQHVEEVYGFLLARCGSRVVAEDLTAETFVHAARQVARDGCVDIGKPWLLTVARRRLVDHWRVQSRRAERLERLRVQELVALTSDQPADADDRVLQALQSLGARQRAALALRHLDDYSVTEIAEVLDVSYRAAESVLARARKAFSAAYEELQ